LNRILNKIRVLFDIRHLYYLPQFLPVAQAMERDDSFEVYYSAYIDKARRDQQLIKKAILTFSENFIDAKNEKSRRAKIMSLNFDVTIFGKSAHADEYCSANTIAILLYHGIGVKSCYYTDYHPRIDVRYVESRYRLDELKRRGITTELVVSGFPKLDPLFDVQSDRSILKIPGLDPEKPTILYAPTFYPASIEVFGDSLAELTTGCNLIVKLHHLSWLLKKYRRHLELMQNLSEKYAHVHLIPPEQYNIVPLYKIAGLLLTEASSTAFEFLATGKPVIICDFYHLRLKHRLFYNSFRKSRLDTEILPLLDFAYHIKAPRQLPNVVQKAIIESAEYKQKIAGKAEFFLGNLDGKASQRIVQDLLTRFK
jgi:hypothetical protein